MQTYDQSSVCNLCRADGAEWKLFAARGGAAEDCHAEPESASLCESDFKEHPHSVS